jgi:hypothetical protein
MPAPNTALPNGRCNQHIPTIGADMKLFGKYIFRGIMAIIRLWITWLVVAFVFRQLLTIGEPIVSRTRQWLSSLSPEVSAQIA